MLEATGIYTDPDARSDGDQGGHGQKPARHVPWQEVFKHHISVLEGHHRMLGMIMKHTVPATENYKLIHEMVDRAGEMLRMSKIASRVFATPIDQREQGPFASSSASTSPGHSPAHNVHSNGAQVYATTMGQTKAQVIRTKPPANAPQHGIGQTRVIKTQKLASMNATSAPQRGRVSSAADSGTDPQTAEPTKPRGTMNRDLGSTQQSVKEGKFNERPEPLFVVDVKSTPVNIPKMPPPILKRTSGGEVSHGQSEATKSKRSKIKHDGDIPKLTMINKVELEDISEEVDARLREKEAKRNRKREKKRKRETEGSDTLSVDPVEPNDEADKPKIKKKKKTGDSGQTTVAIPKSSSAEKKTPRKRKLEALGEKSAEPPPEPEGVGKPKKKPKRSKDNIAGIETVSQKRNGSDQVEPEGKRNKKRKTVRDDMTEI